MSKPERRWPPAEAVAVAMDMTTRKAIALPDELRARLEPLMIEG